MTVCLQMSWPKRDMAEHNVCLLLPLLRVSRSRTDTLHRKFKEQQENKITQKVEEKMFLLQNQLIARKDLENCSGNIKKNFTAKNHFLGESVPKCIFPYFWTFLIHASKNTFSKSSVKRTKKCIHLGQFTRPLIQGPLR